MMKLGSMRTVCETILPGGRCPVVEDVLAPWDHDTGSDRFIVASSNFTASLTAGGERRIVRFVRADERERDAIEAELDFLRHVAGRGVWVNLPIESRAGRRVETVATPLGEFHAVVFNAMAGEARESEQLGPDAYEPWGRALGGLHNAAGGYRDRRRPSWREKLEQTARDLEPDDSVGRAAIEKLRAALESLPATDANFGLIHWDFCADNLRWGCERLGVIDFDDCAHDWHAADIAYALRDLFDDRASRVDPGNPLLGAFIRGYRSARPLDGTEIARLPLFMLMSNLIFYASLRIIVEEPSAAIEPQWVNGIRGKLDGKRKKYREELEWWLEAGHP
jgi:Ser/Thr protein kinase RdoA (MazF antagonist)